MDQSVGADYGGIFALSWTQTEIDGRRTADPSELVTGAQWRWWGQAVRIDGPQDVPVPGAGETERRIRIRARRSVQKLLGEVLPEARAVPFDDIDGADGRPGLLSLTDGFATYDLTLTAGGAQPLLVSSGRLPPRDTDLWVVDHGGEDRAATSAGQASGMVCFVPGTLIRTPHGPRPVEELRPGDRVTTRDDGAQEVIWVGGRRLGGARLHAMPHLLPVRVAAGATGGGGEALLVSPDHRLLIRDRRARQIFGEDEVLVRAADLTGEPGIRVETGLREVRYVHLMTERHQVIVANGVETETFHPAEADLAELASADRASLVDCIGDPARYGPPARRALTTPDVAILKGGAQGRVALAVTG